MDEENVNAVANRLESAIQQGKGLETDEKQAVIVWAERLYNLYGDYDRDNSEDAKAFATLFATLIRGNL